MIGGSWERKKARSSLPGLAATFDVSLRLLLIWLMVKRRSASQTTTIEAPNNSFIHCLSPRSAGYMTNVELMNCKCQANTVLSTTDKPYEGDLGRIDV